MKKVPIGRNEEVFLTKLEFLRKFRTSKTRKSSYFYEDRQRQSEGLWDRKPGYKVCAKLKKHSMKEMKKFLCFGVLTSNFPLFTTLPDDKIKV